MDLSIFKKLAGLFLAFILGGLNGFFVVLSAVFSDYGGQVYERLASMAVVAITYSILGFIFGYFGKKDSWWWGVYLSLPAVSFLLVYMVKEQGAFLISVVYVFVTVLFAAGSSYLGSKTKGNPWKKSKDNGR